jgi:Uma2 family endonuclease
MTTTLDEDALVAQVEEEHYGMAGAAHHNLVIRLYEGLLTEFDGHDDVCVLAEVTWFLPDHQPMIPDVVVIRGAPQSEPTSWRQDHGDAPPTVIIEVVSPGDTEEIHRAKLDRFELAGTQEVWFLHLLTGAIVCWRKTAEGNLRIVHDDTSQLLNGVRFGVGPDGRVVPFFSDGDEFPSHLAVVLARARSAEDRALVAEDRATSAEDRALSAEDRAMSAEDRAMSAEDRAMSAETQLERLSAALRARGVDPTAL